MPEADIVKLPAEPGTPLMIKLPKIADQLKCFLAGVEPNTSLIIRLPAMVNNGWDIQEQMTCIVRFISQGTVYGFNTYVQSKLIKDPLRYLFLAFPTSLEIVNLRQSQRIACHLPSKVVVESVGLDGVVLDIGQGGVSFVHRLASPSADLPGIHLGTEVELYSTLWGMAGEQKITCQVRNINLDSRSLSLGMSFVRADEEITNCVSAYVEKVATLLKNGV